VSATPGGRDYLSVLATHVALRRFAREDLPSVEPWFLDPDTRRFLGGPEWPALMLAREGLVGEKFRGATQTAAYRYVAHTAGRPFGYVDCGTFDRCTLYGGEDSNGPIILETLEVTTAAIAFVVDPEQRRRGLGQAMIAALLSRPELRHTQLFEAGVEPENIASRRCLEASGFRLRSERPDFEGMLQYRAWRTGTGTGTGPDAAPAEP
jgi:RimJ/RimL family protein N-acetyltransferase